MINKKVKLQLVGINGNAFAIMGAFKRQAQKEKWTAEEIDLSKDINYLLNEMKDDYSIEKFYYSINKDFLQTLNIYYIMTRYVDNSYALYRVAQYKDNNEDLELIKQLLNQFKIKELLK